MAAKTDPARFCSAGMARLSSAGVDLVSWARLGWALLGWAQLGCAQMCSATSDLVMLFFSGLDMGGFTCGQLECAGWYLLGFAALS